MAVLGSALGLRCTVRALPLARSRRAGWLTLGAVAIGSGIWTMHFIAMMGFTAHGVRIGYDARITFASLAVAILVVGIGVFIVGYRGRTVPALIGAGVITGLGVAAMHYLGMAGMRMPGHLTYAPVTVALSVAIAVVAATAALWFAISVKGVGPALGASLIMGVAVCGMHYVGMAALSVHAHAHAGSATGQSPTEILAPMLIGPLVLMLFVGLIVGFDPMSRGEQRRRESGAAMDELGTPAWSHRR
ncbi:MHYT domain-containing protein [Streptomyces sp. H27-D2]|nr:MHYT domain-containing protein [Streptomyces sp. H27-D2]MEC4019461.1 MHYT domain-containing protein [Streptomyces sp. H27-D2]